MDREPYLFTEIQPLVYTFVSKGPKGVIKKFVVYQPTDSPDEYSIALLDETAAGFSDSTVSDNKDMDRVLATVIETMTLFLDQNPYASLVFTGSSEARTRLYRAVVSRYVDRVSEKFDIYGVVNDDYEKFVVSRPYTSFIIRLRHEN